MNVYINKLIVLFITLPMSFYSVSGVVIGGTRLIYEQDLSQASISVYNPDDQPYLIQSWVNKNSLHEDNDDTFISVPPIFKIEPKNQNSVRIIYTGKSIPQDRESVFWLNIKSIPSSDPNAKNQLLITIKNKMKLLYRPSGLSGDPSLAYQKLEFISKNRRLKILNPTCYNISIYQIEFDGKEQKGITMIPAKDEVDIPINEIQYHSVKWSAINDFGGITKSVYKKLK